VVEFIAFYLLSCVSMFGVLCVFNYPSHLSSVLYFSRVELFEREEVCHSDSVHVLTREVFELFLRSRTSFMRIK
jgi:hypothetical protein